MLHWTNCGNGLWIKKRSMSRSPLHVFCCMGQSYLTCPLAIAIEILANVILSLSFLHPGIQQVICAWLFTFSFAPWHLLARIFFSFSFFFSFPHSDSLATVTLQHQHQHFDNNLDELSFLLSLLFYLTYIHHFQLTLWPEEWPCVLSVTF